MKAPKLVSLSICYRSRVLTETARQSSFQGLGFAWMSGKFLPVPLRKHGRENVVSVSVESAYGTRRSVDGPLATPDGRNPQIRTVWILAKGGRAPRLINAHPSDPVMFPAPRKPAELTLGFSSNRKGIDSSQEDRGVRLSLLYSLEPALN